MNFENVLGVTRRQISASEIADKADKIKFEKFDMSALGGATWKDARRSRFVATA